jgi:transcriptional regulator with XRE-family HTH domain
MGHRPREKPEHLGAKLLAIREHLGLSQRQLGKRLGFESSYARIAEYESGNREPNLLVLLSYARLARVPLERVIDDALSLF